MFPNIVIFLKEKKLILLDWRSLCSVSQIKLIFKITYNQEIQEEMKKHGHEPVKFLDVKVKNIGIPCHKLPVYVSIIK